MTSWPQQLEASILQLEDVSWKKNSFAAKEEGVLGTVCSVFISSNFFGHQLDAF